MHSAVCIKTIQQFVVAYSVLRQGSSPYVRPWLFFFKLRENMHYMKFTILTIFKYIVQGREIHPHFCATITTIHLLKFFILQN